MTIEIKELVIRAVVDPSEGSTEKPQEKYNQSPAANEEMVAECVEQVLEVLRRQQER